MTFQLVAYEKLKGNLIESVKTLIKHYTPKADTDVDPSKLENLLNGVTADRRPQCFFLLKVIGLLDKSSESTDSKARVLNSLAFYLHQKIEASYTHLSPTNSNLYNALTTALGLSKENTPDKLDLPDMYSALSEFLRTRIYKLGDPRNGYLNEQVLDIPDYEIETDLKAIENKMHELRIINIDDAYKTYLKLQKPKASESGYFGSLFGTTTVTKTEKPKASHKKVSKKQVETVSEEPQSNDTPNRDEVKSHAM
ncbi:hypothetical protein [Legionella waltersii]|uniref:Dot/Icm T4SS effector n=1 Tax=Legionella waltersii TaxID=66969 RepID=A0A0W1A1K8_9GAMM|nr:hypothetical protein [Legionella waltersii]KTD75255.1 Dot/Icm T4SS effector [Legionella waltersii]SNV06743.1 Dot/Icm T4SS effector [Legionella waltersii]